MKKANFFMMTLAVLAVVFWACQNSQSPMEAVAIKSNLSPDAHIQCGGEEGCSHGYWKNHPQSWVSHTPETQLGTVFDFGGCSGRDYYELQHDTFMEALNYAGGPGTLGAAKIMFKQAMAAMLNAAHPDIDYPNDEQWIINYVNYRLDWANRDEMLWLADVFDVWNNQFCPFDAELDE